MPPEQLRKQLGKITEVKFGFGGYQDAQIGISFMFGGDGWGVGTFWGHWAMARSERTEWTEGERLHSLGETVMKIKQILEDAKVQSVDDLKGVPVECEFDGNLLKDWRVLKEVL